MILILKNNIIKKSHTWRWTYVHIRLFAYSSNSFRSTSVQSVNLSYGNTTKTPQRHHETFFLDNILGMNSYVHIDSFASIVLFQSQLLSNLSSHQRTLLSVFFFKLQTMAKRTQKQRTMVSAGWWVCYNMFKMFFSLIRQSTTL